MFPIRSLTSQQENMFALAAGFILLQVRLLPLQKGQNSNQLVRNSPIGRAMAFRLNFLSCCFRKVSHQFPVWHILCCYFSFVVKGGNGKEKLSVGFRREARDKIYFCDNETIWYNTAN
jgi:hypothetical protein